MRIKTNTYNICSEKIPESFNGFTITQISDVHGRKLNDEFFDNITGDIVVLTGDILDGHAKYAKSAIQFIERIKQPVYFVTGNHEGTNHVLFKTIEITFKNNPNVKILHNESISLWKNDEVICLLGLDDLKYLSLTEGRDIKAPDYRLESFNINQDTFSIVLLHSPNNIKTIAQSKPDLVLSGHTHGGQFRLPFLGAIYAPGQGLFPEYDKGLYRVESTDLIVNSGIGFSRIPIRINCPAEINNIVLSNVPKSI